MNRYFFAMLCCVIPWPALAQTGYPMVMSLKPTAAQVGVESEIEFHSRYSMFGAWQVLVSGDGVTGEVVHPEKKDGETPELTTMKVRFKIEPDAMPGVRDVKIATPQGVSTVGQLLVTRDAVTYEVAGNDSRDKAQEVQLPGTLCGVIEKNEDVDWFKFHAEAGEEWSFHMHCARLQDRVHDMQRHADPMITIRNASGGTVAAVDNYYFADPFLAVKFERAGDYYLEIRDVRYHGNTYWEYAVEATNRPFVSNAYPLGIGIGAETSVELVGSGLPDGARSAITLNGDTQSGAKWCRPSIGEFLANPVAIYATSLPTVLESDADNNLPENAQSVTLPAGINGRIGGDSDVDCYTFEAKKGEQFTFEVRARRYQSAIDPYIRIVDATGRQLAENDDLREFKRSFADSRIDTWTVPADGAFTLEIRDMHLRGGNDFVYFIEATAATPHFQLYADTDKTLLSPGGNGVVFVQAERRNGFTGEIQLHIEGLPESVEAVCGRILPDKGRDGCIILRAAPEAELKVANVRIYGTSTWKPSEEVEPVELTATASVYQEMYQPGGGRGHWPVETHTVSVGALADVRRVTLSEHDITLKPGETRKIEVTIERAEGFDKNVSLDMRFFHLSEFCNTLPPGVTFDESASSKLLTGKNVKGHVVVKADANAAPVDRQLVPVTANVSLNFVMKTTFSADPLWLSVVADAAAEKSQ